ncbi:MAG: hypothetical protein ACREJD_10665 [Phycisphaerales bacterium]
MLTASHVIDSEWKADTRPLLNVDGLFVEADVLRRSDGLPPADWLLFRPRFDTGAFAFGDPNSIQRRLANPMRARLRFDGNARIPSGTTLYGFGFVYAAELESTESLPLTAAIIHGLTVHDLEPGEPIRFRCETTLSLNGMSGGPIAYYDKSTECLVIVGILVRSNTSKSYWRPNVLRFVIGSRLPTEIDAVQQ